MVCRFPDAGQFVSIVTGIGRQRSKVVFLWRPRHTILARFCFLATCTSYSRDLVINTDNLGLQVNPPQLVLSPPLAFSASACRRRKYCPTSPASWWGKCQRPSSPNPSTTCAFVLSSVCGCRAILRTLFYGPRGWVQCKRGSRIDNDEHPWLPVVAVSFLSLVGLFFFSRRIQHQCGFVCCCVCSPVLL